MSGGQQRSILSRCWRYLQLSTPLATGCCCKSAPSYKVQSNIALPSVIYSNKANSVFSWTILRSFVFLIFVSFVERKHRFFVSKTSNESLACYSLLLLVVLSICLNVTSSHSGRVFPPEFSAFNHVWYV